MKAIRIALIINLVAAYALSGEIIVHKVRGNVSVRRGVTETWARAAVGDTLHPDDTMKTGALGSAVIIAPLETVGHTGAKNIALPSEVMVDMSDIRDLSQEELMLKLTMEKVRSSPSEWKNKEMNIPNTTVVHGPDKTPSSPMPENDLETGKFQMSGTKVLFQNGFYSTCALKAMEVFRRFPSLGANLDNRLMVAEALENARLRGEALNEYLAISKAANISVEQQTKTRLKIEQLRKETVR